MKFGMDIMTLDWSSHLCTLQFPAINNANMVAMWTCKVEWHKCHLL